ncbi:MAG TPA: hypothetical protein VM942_05485 [Acidimicrobiales bacterium]|nr:hypothetical protein [Acidimicrobiales bacterium]
MRARRFLAGAVVVAGLAGLGGEAAGSPASSVSGAGMVTLPPEYGDEAGDHVLFQLRAHAGPAPAGTFNVVHLDDAGGLYAHVVGDITCVSVSDGIAVTTGVIRRAWFRDFPGALVVDTDVAITVADNGSNDALGFYFEFFDDDVEIPSCAEVAAVIPVTRGNFKIR